MSTEADLERLGTTLVLLRSAKGLSARQVAQRVGVSATYIGDIEKAKPGRSGQPARPAVPFLKVLADVLDVPRYTLLELAGYDEAAAWERVEEARRGRSPSTDEDPVLSALSGVIAPEDLPTVLEIVNRFRKPVDE